MLSIRVACDCIKLSAVQVVEAAVQVVEADVPVVGVLHPNFRYPEPEQQRVHGGAGEGGIEVNGCVPSVELPWRLFPSPLDDREAFCKQKLRAANGSYQTSVGIQEERECMTGVALRTQELGDQAEDI